MALVPLVFQERWRPLVLSGAKTTTVRTKRHGAEGDEFELDGVRFRLTRVEQMALRFARERHWRTEGMASPDEFEEVWRANHPVRGFRETDLAWVHEFERVP